MKLFRAFLTALTFLALLSPSFADPGPVTHYAPAENLEYVGVALTGAPMTDCVGKTTTATTNQMAILAPCSQNVITANQKTAPALIAMDITDANAAVNAGLIPISVQALGMQNVEVWTHGSMAVRLTAGAGGMFTGNLDLSKEPTGPLRARFMAWNSSPGDDSLHGGVDRRRELILPRERHASRADRNSAGRLRAGVDEQRFFGPWLARRSSGAGYGCAAAPPASR